MKSSGSSKKFPTSRAEVEAAIARVPGTDRLLTSREEAKWSTGVMVNGGGYEAVRKAVAAKRKPGQRGQQVAPTKQLVVRFIKIDTYYANPRSNLFQRNTTGAALNSAMPLRIRAFSSSFDLTRMCRRKVRAIFEKAHSIRLSQEPCLGV